jgi:hypothetical protein
VYTDTVSAQLHRLNWLLRARVVEAKLRELERAVKTGFDPNQPRVPAGSPDGGQWTGGGGGGGSSAGSPTASGSTLEKIVSLARRIAAGSPLDYQRCLDLCYPLLERRQRPGSDRNKWDFHKCMNACIGLNL